MDYEKKYKEALDWIRDLYPTMEGAVREDAEHYFSELKDNEDEIVRQEIRTFIWGHPGKLPERDRWLAWLEKQNSNADTANKEYWRGYREGKQEIIDKYAELEKQAEQNPMNKNKHKFHEGDWIVFNNHHDSMYQVEKIENYEYTLRHFLGGSMHLSFSHEDMIRAWTLKDAKDGDVLAGEYDDYKKPWVGIFKCISENRPQRQFDSYCFIISSRHGFITPDSCDFYNFCKGHTIRYTKPATKEQRDMLFQKMHEAGYEWDAERKELKELSPSEVTKIDDQEQKPAWSAEDEERYLSCLKRLGTGDIRQPETINTVWLKSVKNRIQPKQEWSEEDEAMFQGVIETEQYMLDVVYGRKIFAVGNEAIKEECTKELAWLKSLKDRIK